MAKFKDEILEIPDDSTSDFSSPFSNGKISLKSFWEFSQIEKLGNKKAEILIKAIGEISFTRLSNPKFIFLAWMNVLNYGDWHIFSSGKVGCVFHIFIVSR